MRTIDKEKLLARIGRVAVLKGGRSAEREISLMSGHAVFNGLLRLGVDAVDIDVGAAVIDDLRAARPELVVIMLHGEGGEDGVIQGLLETMGLPYTGSGVLASALAMDKAKSKSIWQHRGLPTAEFQELTEDSDWEAVMNSLGKVVVKPISGGSSLGVAIAEDVASLLAEYRDAAAFGGRVLAERYIDGREFSIGIIGDDLLPAIQLETDRQFFDFEAKYKDENTRIICPARISAAEDQAVRRLVEDAYRSLGCAGLARVDLMQDDSGQFYLLELNTVPGMTEHSFVPASAKRMGMSFDDLLLLMLDYEMQRHFGI